MQRKTDIHTIDLSHLENYVRMFFNGLQVASGHRRVIDGRIPNEGFVSQCRRDPSKNANKLVEAVTELNRRGKGSPVLESMRVIIQGAI